jgi:hypothetical protein
MEMDIEAAYIAYTVNDYCDARYDRFLPNYRPVKPFTMDNVSIHTAGVTTNLMMDYRILGYEMAILLIRPQP